MPRNLRIVFFGTPDFAVESLRSLVEQRVDIAGVVTMPDKPAGRGHKLFQSPVKEFALQKGLKLFQPQNLKDPGFIEDLSSLKADLFIVIAFRMLPEVVWKMPPLGTFNLHASLLPKYRGAAPINWAIINGEEETGVSTFFLKHEIDTGDIIDQKRIKILPEDNAGTIHDKLMSLGAQLTVDTVKRLEEGAVIARPQHDYNTNGAPSLAPKIFKDTCRINWNQSALQIHNLVRGLSPYPGAWTEIMFEDQSVVNCKILETEISSTKSEKPGTVYIKDDNLYIDCEDISIKILVLKPDGKKRLNAGDYLRGLRIRPIKAI
ncbi:MAG: methionyl-tRNA formyltransferase [Paramuribaculum sp.]|nr:methionyl-tRNA formyltransferase [Paramuribaculum sp.]